jgi:hypothetical protein
MRRWAGRILDFGRTQYPGLLLPDERLSNRFHHLLTTLNICHACQGHGTLAKRAPGGLGNNGSRTLARHCSARMADRLRAVRRSIGSFVPDLVLLKGNDEYAVLYLAV